MPAIARFVGLDLRSMLPNAKYMVIPVVITGAPVLLFFGPYPLITAIASLAAVSVPSYLFGNDDRGRLDTLYTALGIQRRHVVAGRYATCLLLLIALTVAGLLLAALAARTFDVAFDWTIATAFAIGSLGLIGLFLAAELPVYFGTGPGPVRAAVTIPPSLIVVGALVVWALPGVRAGVLSWLDNANVTVLAIAMVVVVGVLGVISTALSARLYARRDL